MEVKFKKLVSTAVTPYKAHATDAGFDLTCASISTVRNECGQMLLVYHSGISVEIPEGYVGLVFARSSIYKKSLSPCNCTGVIDSGFRGEITFVMRSTTDVIPAIYKEGDRFAQLVIVKLPEIVFSETEELSESDRGENGYGSSDNQSTFSDSADKATDQTNVATNDSTSESENV